MIDLKDASEVLKVAPLVRCYGFWSGLKANDIAVLAFVYEATLLQGEERAALSHRSFLVGVYDTTDPDTYDTLVAPVPMSERTLVKSIRRLREDGILKIERGHKTDPESKIDFAVTLYSLDLQKLVDACVPVSKRYRLNRATERGSRHERPHLRLV